MIAVVAVADDPADEMNTRLVSLEPYQTHPHVPVVEVNETYPLRPPSHPEQVI